VIGPVRSRRAHRGRWLALGLLLALVAATRIWRAPLEAHVRTILLLTQELPQSPVRPLEALTAPPAETRVRLDSPAGPVVADLLRPVRRLEVGEEPRRAAVVLTLGVALAESDRPVLLHFARTLARLGYVVLWPRSEALDAGAIGLESPETFVAAVEYVKGLEGVDGERVSLLGFSVGASIGLVAAADPAVAEDVRAVISFGGYYELPEYLIGVASHSTTLDDGRVVPWEPNEETVRRVREVPAALGASGVLHALDATTREEATARLRAAPAEELAALARYDPAAHRQGLAARVFILHDRGDFFVPFAESLRLSRALPPQQVAAFLLTDLFQHAQPRAGLSWGVARDVVALYGFVRAALEAI
jgi:dienelactone hydrolase